MTNPNPFCLEPVACLPPYPIDEPDLDPKAWIMANIYLDDPIELRRNELRGWAQAAGFTEVEVNNLGEPDFWEMRFRRGTNAECSTPAAVEQWFRYIARGCRCQVEPGQFIAIVDRDRIAVRLRLTAVPP